MKKACLILPVFFLLWIIWPSSFVLAQEELTPEEATSGAEFILPKNSLFCTDFEITGEVSGAPETNTSFKDISGELWLEKGKQPTFSLMEKRLNSTLPKLLPLSLKETLNIDRTSLKTRGKHFVISQGEEEKELKEEEIPETQLTLPSWWTTLLGETKILCGLFGTCEPPKKLTIKVKQPDLEKLSKSLNYERNAHCRITEPVIATQPAILHVKKRFGTKVLAFLKKIIEIIEGKEVTTNVSTVTFEDKSRGYLVGGKTITTQSTFLNNFLPFNLVDPSIQEMPLAGEAKFEIKADAGNLQMTGEGAKKLNFQQQQQTRASYCLQICSLYPQNFDITTIDPLCPSCDAQDYVKEKKD